MAKHRENQHRSVILLFSAFLTACICSSAESSLVLKKDPATNEAMIVEEGPLTDSNGIPQGEDHISGDQLPSDSRFKQYMGMVDEAVSEVQQGFYDQAIEKLKSAIDIEPCMPYAYDNLANAYYHLQKYAEAIEMSKSALKMNPEYANAYGNLGSIYYALEKYPEAKENYQKARELFQKKGDLQGVAITDEYLAQSFPE